MPISNFDTCMDKRIVGVIVLYKFLVPYIFFKLKLFFMQFLKQHIGIANSVDPDLTASAGAV